MNTVNNVRLADIEHIHFIGIGGIGISALARLMKHEGKTVTGNDLKDFPVIPALREAGIEVTLGEESDAVPEEAELIVYSVAWEQINPQILADVRERGVPVLTYPEMLGLVSKHKYTIAVSGTHGKTTTTAMIASVFLAAGYDPTVIVGSLMDTSAGERTNFIAGDSSYLIVEACEYKRSFLHLEPDVLVITNVDEDHLDYYRDLADIQSAFRELAQRVPASGYIVAPVSDERVAPVLDDVDATIVDYAGIADRGFQLAVPGEHNLANAYAASVASEICGIDEQIAREALNAFRGTWRRFDYLGETEGGAVVYDDYAHHPREIQTTLAGFRNRFPDQRLIVIFQPHLYSRTRDLLSAFAKSFTVADEVIIAPIYAAREENSHGISHHDLAEEAARHHPRVRSLDGFDEIVADVRDHAAGTDVIITMGAGDIRSVGERLVVLSEDNQT